MRRSKPRQLSPLDVHSNTIQVLTRPNALQTLIQKQYKYSTKYSTEVHSNTVQILTHPKALQILANHSKEINQMQYRCSFKYSTNTDILKVIKSSVWISELVYGDSPLENNISRSLPVLCAKVPHTYTEPYEEDPVMFFHLSPTFDSYAQCKREVMVWLRV